GLQFFPIELVQRLATMFLEEATQDVVQEFAGVDRLQIERGLATRFEPQHALREEAIRTVAVNAQAAGAVNEVRTELLLDQAKQIGIGDDAVVRTIERA